MTLQIVYASRNGVTRECVQMLASHFSSNFEIRLIDIEKDTPDLDEGNFVVGGPIRYGKLYKPVRNFIKANAKRLQDRVIGVFLCSGLPGMAQEYKRKVFPSAWLERAPFGDFGGELKPDKLKGMDKMVVKMVRAQILQEEADIPADDNDFSRALPEIVPENIERFALALKRDLLEKWSGN